MKHSNGLPHHEMPITREMSVKKQYTLSEIEALPTLAVAQDSDLKAEEWDPVSGTGTRVWLVRDPDQPMVSIERYDPEAVREGLPGHATPPTGAWEIVESYEPVDDTRDDEDDEDEFEGFASAEELEAFETALSEALPDADELAGDGLLRAQLGQVAMSVWLSAREHFTQRFDVDRAREALRQFHDASIDGTGDEEHAAAVNLAELVTSLLTVDDTSDD